MDKEAWCFGIVFFCFPHLSWFSQKVGQLGGPLCQLHGAEAPTGRCLRALRGLPGGRRARAQCGGPRARGSGGGLRSQWGEGE